MELSARYLQLLLAWQSITCMANPDFTIGAYGPYSTKFWQVAASSYAAKLAWERNAVITVPNKQSFTINIALGDSASSPSVGINTVLGFLGKISTSDNLVGFTGGFHSNICGGTALLSSAMSIPQVAYGCIAASLGDKKTYKYFVRMASSSSGVAMASLAKKFGFSRMTCVASDENFGTSIKDQFVEAATTRGIEATQIITPYDPVCKSIASLSGTTPSFDGCDDTAGTAMMNSIQQKLVQGAKQFRARVFGLSCTVTECAKIIVAAWTIPGIGTNGLFGTNYFWFGTDPVVQNSALVVTDPGLAAATAGRFLCTKFSSIGPKASADYSPFLSTLSLSDFPTEVTTWIKDALVRGGNAAPTDADAAAEFESKKLSIATNTVQVRAFDAVFAIMVAINQMLAAGTAVTDVKNKALLEEIVNKVAFQGISGSLGWTNSANDWDQGSYGERAGNFDIKIIDAATNSWKNVLLWDQVADDVISSSSWTGSNPYLDGSFTFPPDGSLQACGVDKFFGTASDGSLTCLACPDPTWQEQPLATAAGSCVCKAGSFKNGTSADGNPVCVTCSAGKFQDAPGSTECLNCDVGKYSIGAAAACTRCAKGTYSGVVGQSECLACSATLSGSSTLSEGMEASTDCACPAGSFFHDSSCLPCKEGMDCPGGNGLPMTQKGYMMRGGNLFVYKCVREEDCPGGPPDTCKGRAMGLACAECENDWQFKLGECHECGGLDQVLMYIFLVVIVVCVGILYYMLDSSVSSKMTSLLCTACAFGNLVSAMQVFAVYNMLAIPWPKEIKAFLEFVSIFAMDFDLLGIGCAWSNNPSTKYLSSALVMPFIMSVVFLQYVLFNALVKANILSSRWKWEFPKTLNECGTLCQVAFVTMSAVAMTSVTCYSHPVDSKSLVIYPEVICGSSKHAPIIIFGVFLATITTLFFANALYGAWRAPQKAAAGNVTFLQSYRWLFFRFRVDVWYWGCASLFRGLVLAAIPPVVPEHPHLQMILIILVLTVPMVFQLRKWPWKAPLLNVVDALISVLLIVMIATSAAFMDKADGGEADGYKNLMIAQVGILNGLIVVVIGMAIVSLARRGAFGTPADVFNLGSVPDPQELGKVWKGMAVATSKMDDTAIQEACRQLPVYDLQAMNAVLGFLLSGGATRHSGEGLLRTNSLRVFAKEAARGSFTQNIPDKAGEKQEGSKDPNAEVAV